MSNSPPSLDTIFCEAIELRSPEARSAFVTEACAGDEDLRRQVESLVAAHIRAGSFLDRPDAPAGPTEGWADPEVVPGALIGPYKLRELLGEGGMGVVYVAEQTRPVRRRVALKLIKPGMDTREVVARFEVERQALALMDHPNIARVLDAGATEAGRPYFVMELVRGLPITDYCDKAALSPSDRLKLFAQVCRAVQHAHQKGVIHRDLKPSNVMVTLHDATPVPKVIDFGVAKAVNQALTERSLYTRFAQLVGTPLYMAPEQAELSGLDIDTRADVYALGVLLYELLTGTTPFDKETLHRAGLDEVRRIIREEEPLRPSLRVSTLGLEERSGVSGRRGLDERRLVHLLRGDLDWVAMKALEKDRNRRYESAGAFAADVERYLADEPVEAGPPSKWYRARKAARRHRGALATAGLVAAALVVGTVVSVWQAVKAREAERQAITGAAIARAVNDFFQDAVVQQVNTGSELDGAFVTVREALLRAAAQIEQRFQDQPIVEAAIRNAIGDAFISLEEFNTAIPHLERAVSLRKTHLGAGHPHTLASMSSLAGAYSGLGQASDAIALRQIILETQITALGPDHPQTLACLEHLANAYGTAGQQDMCVRLRRQLLEKLQVTHGMTHPVTLYAMNSLAIGLRNLGHVQEAIAVHESVLELRKSTMAVPNTDCGLFLISTAVSYQAAGRFDQADQMFKKVLELYRDRNDTAGRLTRATTLGWLARLRLLQQRYADGEAMAREVLAVFDRERPWDARRFYWMNVLGGLLSGQGKYVEAEVALVQGYEGMGKAKGIFGVDWRFRDAGERVVRFYEATNQTDKARAWREKLSSTDRTVR